ncbi:MAG: DUF1919 domain-containing protein [Prevotella sp.]|nr:DUF1919 domain-containing protein [Prevotella sp.]
MNIWNSINYHLREKINILLGPIRLKRIRSEYRDFTLISNNCWGGHVYRYFKLPYNSPTVGMYFFADDYIRFVSSLEKYLSLEIEMISAKESNHYSELLANHKDSLDKPIGRLDDVEIVFLHCNTAEEAKLKWTRRTSRVNLNNVIVKMSEMNGCTKEHLKAFDNLQYERKFVFVTRDYKLRSQVIFKEYEGKDEIKNDTTLFRKYINLENLINGQPFKKKQRV